MNSKKYKDALYTHRTITDLKDMLYSSSELYDSRAAFLVKDSHKTPYRPISYSNFRLDVDALGTALIEHGLKGEKISVMGENSYEWVVGYFAVTCGTGTIVPMDKELKPDEIANLLNRAKVSCLMYTNKMEKVVKEVMPKVPGIKLYINLNEEKVKNEEIPMADLIKEGKSLMADGDRRFIDAKIDPEEVCSILFTSGTMGVAKGVMLTHKNLISNVMAMSQYVGVTGETSLSVLPMHHTYEMTCHILTSIYQGVSIGICEGLRYIQANLAELNANIMLGVPLVFEMFHKRIMKAAKNSGKLEKMQRGLALSKRLKLYNKPAVVNRLFSDVHENLQADIKHFIVGGAPVNPEIIEDFQAMGYPIFQGYGMTEVSPIIAVNKDRYGKPAAAGLPLPGTQVKIVDKTPSGMGEIVVKSDSVMKGYFEDPEETAAVLSEDGWLATGDYGYFDDEGFLYVTGRKKSVIVTKNGKNIFPEEVEFYLTENDFIEEALVHGVDGGTDKGLIIKAEIYPNYELINEHYGDVGYDEICEVVRKAIREANEKLPHFKQVQRFAIRDTEFIKTTTRKVKRYIKENLESGKEEQVGS